MKKLLSLVLILVLVFSLSGCATANSGEHVDRDSSFILINDNIVYDEDTEICYYWQYTYYAHYVATPFIGKDKNYVTKDEYLKLYSK